MSVPTPAEDLGPLPAVNPREEIVSRACDSLAFYFAMIRRDYSLTSAEAYAVLIEELRKTTSVLLSVERRKL